MLGESKNTGRSLFFSIVLGFLISTFNFALIDSGAQTGTFQVSVAGTAVGSIPHQIDLKVTQLPGGQLSEVTGFIAGPEDVIQVKQGENLIVSTSPDLKTHKVKVTNTQSQLSELLPLSSNTWSLEGLTPGVYKLDVIVEMSSSGIMGAYETILVTLTPGQQPLPPAQYITLIQSVSVRSDIIFKDKEEPSICYFDPSDKACDPDKNAKCRPGFGLNDDDRCVPIGKCPDGYGRLDDDETGTCYPKRDIQKCPDGSIRHKFQACPEVIPICDENTPPGVTCRDEGDPDDCEPGFVDRGFGCEPEECPEGQVGTPPNCEPPSEGGGDGGDNGGLFNGGGEVSGGEVSGGEGSGGEGSGGEGEQTEELDTPQFG